MRIGVPTEIKVQEGRVALIPEACAELITQGHKVFLQAGAGRLSGYPDEAYLKQGVQIMPDAAALYASAEIIVKVKEPQPAELAYLKPEHRLFSYLHLAAEPALLNNLLDIGLTAIAFETVGNGHALPLLAPMSDIAGRLAVHIGTTLLHLHHGGRGLLLGGIPAAERGRVVILGAGIAGGNACTVAQALGANVTIFDPNRQKQALMRELGANVTALHPYPAAIDEHIQTADLLIGAVLIPGAKAPHLVSEQQVRGMQPGSVIVDIAVDQGGCIATTRPTNYAEPTYIWSDIVHFCVTNMPGAVPRTASQALSAVLVPYILRLAEPDWALDEELSRGLNVQAGQIKLAALKHSGKN